MYRYVYVAKAHKPRVWWKIKQINRQIDQLALELSLSRGGKKKAFLWFATYLLMSYVCIDLDADAAAAGIYIIHHFFHLLSLSTSLSTLWPIPTLLLLTVPPAQLYD